MRRLKHKYKTRVVLPGSGGGKRTTEAGADGGPVNVGRIDVCDHAHEQMTFGSFIPDNAVSVWLSRRHLKMGRGCNDLCVVEENLSLLAKEDRR